MTESQAKQVIKLLQLQNFQSMQIFLALMMRVTTAASSKDEVDAITQQMKDHTEFITSVFKQLRDEENKLGMLNDVDRAWNEVLDKALAEKRIGFKP
jgi:hypothetical protein